MTRLSQLLVVALSVGLAGPSFAGEPGLTSRDLVRMTRSELLAIYSAADVGAIPSGSTRGRAISNPGSRMTVPASRAIGLLWKGKVFREDGMMINRTFAGRAITAKTFVAESWFDGKPALVLDYADTSKLFPDVRDEQREIAPGLYLGLTYLRKCPEPQLAMFYVLDLRLCGHR